MSRGLPTEAEKFLNAEFEDRSKRNQFPAPSVVQDLSEIACDSVCAYYSTVEAFAESYTKRVGTRPNTRASKAAAAAVASTTASSKTASSPPTAQNSSSASASASSGSTIAGPDSKDDIALEQGFARIVGGNEVHLPNGDVLVSGKFTKKDAPKGMLPSNAKLASEFDELSDGVKSLLLKEVEEAEKAEDAEQKTHVAIPNLHVAWQKTVSEFRYKNLDNQTRPARPWLVHPSVSSRSQLKSGKDKRLVPTTFQYVQALLPNAAACDQPHSLCSTRLVDPELYKTKLPEDELSEIYYSIWTSAVYLLALKRKLIMPGSVGQVLENKLSLGLALAEVGGPGSDPRFVLLGCVRPAIEVWIRQGRTVPVVSHCPACIELTGPESESRSCASCSSRVTYTTVGAIHSDAHESATRRLLNLSKLCGSIDTHARKKDPDFYRFFVGLHSPLLQAFQASMQTSGRYHRWDYYRMLRHFLFPTIKIPCPIRMDLLLNTTIQFTQFEPFEEDVEYKQIRSQLVRYLQLELILLSKWMARAMHSSGMSQELAAGVFKFAFMTPEQRFVGFAELKKEADADGSAMHFIDYFPSEQKQSKEGLAVIDRVKKTNAVVLEHNKEFCRSRGLKIEYTADEKGVMKAEVSTIGGQPVSMNAKLKYLLGHQLSGPPVVAAPPKEPRSKK